MVFFEEGLYKVEATGNGLTQSSKGTPQGYILINILGRYPDNDTSADVEPVEEKKRAIYMPLTEKTVERVVEDLAALGLDDVNSTPFELLDRRSDKFVSLVGKVFNAYCSHNEYNDKVSEKWQIREWKGFADPDEETVSKLDALNEAWKSKMQSVLDRTPPKKANKKPKK